MGTNLNRVTITGQLVCDPILRRVPSGLNVCDVRIACNRGCQDKLTGNWMQWAEHCGAQIAGPLASTVHRCLKKGSAVAIEGRLSSRPSRCGHPEHKRESIVIVGKIQFIPAG
jgi:single-strand DNA-binding protein